MTDLSNIKLFATQPHSCSYLSGQDATTVFVDPTTKIDVQVYSRLSEIGFRRSGSHLYRPHCHSCNACIPARIPANRFKPNRQQKRCWSKNQDIQVRSKKYSETEAHYQLYEKYISTRHADGDMYPPTKSQFDAFLSHEWGVTRYFEFYLEDKLIGVSVSDVMDNGLSAVYTYFDPDYDKRSLGTFAILYQINLAKSLGLPALYLGYWIKNCKKMNYKTQFRPLEMLIDKRWVTIT